MQDAECLTSGPLDGDGGYTQSEGAQTQDAEGAQQHGEQESPMNEEQPHGFEEQMHQEEAGQQESGGGYDQHDSQQCFEEHQQDTHEHTEGQEHTGHHDHDHHEHRGDHGEAHQDHDDHQDHQHQQDHTGDGDFKQGPEDHGERIDHDQADHDGHTVHQGHGEQDHTEHQDHAEQDHIEHQDHAEQEHHQDQAETHDQAEQGDHDQGDQHQDQGQDHHDDGVDDGQADQDHQDQQEGAEHECEAEERAREGTQDQHDDAQDGENAEDNQEGEDAQQDGENAEEQGEDHDDQDHDDDDGDDAEDEQEEEEKGKRKRRYEDEEEEEQETDDKEDDEEDKKKRKRRRKKKKKKKKKKRQHEGDCSSCTDETETTDGDVIHRRHSVGVLRSKSKTSLERSDSTDFHQRRKSHASIASSSSAYSLDAHPVYCRSRSEGGSVASMTSTGSITSTEDSYSVPFYDYYDTSDSDLYTEETDTSSSYEDESSEDPESSAEDEVEDGTTDAADTTTDVAEGNGDPDIDDIINATIGGPITSGIPEIITPDMDIYSFTQHEDETVYVFPSPHAPMDSMTSAIAEPITVDTDIRISGELSGLSKKKTSSNGIDVSTRSDTMGVITPDLKLMVAGLESGEKLTCAEPTSGIYLPTKCSVDILDNQTPAVADTAVVKHITDSPLLGSDVTVSRTVESKTLPLPGNDSELHLCADALAKAIIADVADDPRAHKSPVASAAASVDSLPIQSCDTSVSYDDVNIDLSKPVPAPISLCLGEKMPLSDSVDESQNTNATMNGDLGIAAKTDSVICSEPAKLVKSHKCDAPSRNSADLGSESTENGLLTRNHPVTNIAPKADGNTIDSPNVDSLSEENTNSRYQRTVLDSDSPCVDAVVHLASPSSLSTHGATAGVPVLPNDVQRTDTEDHKQITACADALADAILTDVLTDGIVITGPAPANDTDTTHANKQTGDSSNSQHIPDDTWYYNLDIDHILLPRLSYFVIWVV